jgi:16S rRNA G966 N2-methylase RsmD
VAVEGRASVLAILRANCLSLAPERSVALAGELPGCLDELQGGCGAPFHLVFADPPYGYLVYTELLAGIGRLCGAGSEAAVEHSRREDLPAEVGAMLRYRVRTHGDTSLSFYRRQEPGAANARERRR